MKSSFGRFFVMAIILLLVILLLVGASFQILIRNVMTKQLQADLRSDCAAICQLASAYYGEGSVSHQDFFVNLSVATRVSDADAVICDNTGKLALCSDAPLGCVHQGMVINAAYLEEVFRKGVVYDKGMVDGLYTEARYVVGMPILQNDTPIGLVILSTPVSLAHAMLDKISDSYMVISLLVVLIGVLLITLLAKKQSSPLRDMAKAASAFGHGNLDARVTVEKHSPREVQELALAFNNMASSLQKSEYQRQEFIANVSHELKTPMTTISGYVDGMLDGTIPPERHQQYMQMVSGETKRLSRLVRSMLDISRLQEAEGFPPESLSQFDICEQVGQVLITFEQKIVEKALDVQVDFPEHRVYTRANSDAITQVVYNLVDNGVKFCPEGGNLSLQVKESGRKICVTVGNDGETIPAEELPLVFDRFHKLDKSRTRNADGWGLGLYIVKTLICRHGEDISVTSQAGRTEFTFTLPLVN